MKGSSALAALASLVVLACTMPNPSFDETRDELGGTDDDPTTTGKPTTTGDGDGDPTTTGDGDGEPTTGDGDGEPTTGDGDGEPTTGDGDGDPSPCADWEMLCDGICVDTNTDYEHCGSCETGCEGAQVCGNGECLAKRYVFVTTALFPGNFGEVAFATEICNQQAGDLPGNYRAWVSDGQDSPVQGLDPSGAFVLRNGPIVAYSLEDLLDGELAAPINRNQHGDPIAPSPVEECGLEYAVWTGTNSMGLPAEPNCGGWEFGDTTAKGLVGHPQSAQEWSEFECVAPCDHLLPVYCVQE